MLPKVLLCCAALCALSLPATAEVRFGKNVRIGGHDASNQTFDRQNRGEYTIHEGKPPLEGCYLRRNADGSRTRVCHLQRKRDGTAPRN